MGWGDSGPQLKRGCEFPHCCFSPLPRTGFQLPAPPSRPPRVPSGLPLRATRGPLLQPSPNLGVKVSWALTAAYPAGDGRGDGGGPGARWPAPPWSTGRPSSPALTPGPWEAGCRARGHEFRPREARAQGAPPGGREGGPACPSGTPVQEEGNVTQQTKEPQERVSDPGRK